MDKNQVTDNLINVLKDVHRFLDNIQYELSARQYTLEEDQMAYIFYCRDKIWLTLQDFDSEKGSL